MKRKKGAQPGNRNAWKHGLYSRVLSQPEYLSFQKAASMEGLDIEIALLRLKISQLLEHESGNFNLILRASSTLARLLRVRCHLNPQQSKALELAIGKVLREVALPMGIKSFPEH